MTEKICSACKQPKPFTDYTRDKKARDGLTARCKPCIASTRSSAAKAEKRAIALHEKRLEACRRTLENPDASDLARRNAERDLRLSAKHLEKILKPFNDAREEAAARERAAESAVADAERAAQQKVADEEYDRKREEQERIQAAIKAQADADTLAATTAAIEIMEWAKKFLLMPALDLAKRVNLRDHCHAQAEQCLASAKQAAGQEQLVLKKMAATFKMLVERLAVVTEDFLKNQSTEYFLKTAVSDTNFVFRTPVERALIRHYTKLHWDRAGISTESLPDAPPVILQPDTPSQSLEGLLDMVGVKNSTYPALVEMEEKRMAELEALKISNPKAYAALQQDESLGIKGNDALAQHQRKVIREQRRMDPHAAAQRAMDALRPRNLSLETNIFLVPTWTHDNPHSRDLQYWPNGDLVKAGQIAYDGRLRYWVRVPGPRSMDISFEKAKDSGPTEEQLARMSPETAQWYLDRQAEKEEWTQDISGGWITKSGSSPWEKPDKITFLRGDRHIEGSGRDHFRMGHFWSQAEIDKVEGTHWTDTPPTILAPLPKIGVADSIASAPEKEIPDTEPNRWKRHAQRLAEEASRTKELLN